MFGAAKKLLLDAVEKEPERAPADDLPRLTQRAIENTRMPRSRERILANLDEMYREAFERAKATGDDSSMVSLDFDYRREWTKLLRSGRITRQHRLETARACLFM